MRRASRWVVVVVLVASAIILGSRLWTTYDYGLQCKKCFHRKHVIVQRLAQIPFWRTTAEEPGREDAYRRLYARACDHAFHRGGFGLSTHGLFRPSLVACGDFAEATLFLSRDMAVSATFNAERRLSARGLALASFDRIEQLLPAAATTQSSSLSEGEPHQTLQRFAHCLQGANTAAEWQACLSDPERPSDAASPSETPNQAMRRTAARSALTLDVATPRSLRFTRALAAVADLVSR